MRECMSVCKCVGAGICMCTCVNELCVSECVNVCMHVSICALWGVYVSMRI